MYKVYHPSTGFLAGSAMYLKKKQIHQNAHFFYFQKTAASLSSPRLWCETSRELSKFSQLFFSPWSVDFFKHQNVCVKWLPCNYQVVEWKNEPHRSSAMAHSSLDCLRDITNANEQGNLPVLYTSLLDCSVNRGKDTQYHSLVRRLCGPNCSEHTAALALYNRTCHNHSGKVSREYAPEGESRANQHSQRFCILCHR